MNAALVIVAARVSCRQNYLHVPLSTLPHLLDCHVEHLSPQSLIRVYDTSPDLVKGVQSAPLYALCAFALARPFDDKPITLP